MGDGAVSLWRCFSGLRDPRASRRAKKHPLLSLVASALCAAIAGADDWPQVAAFACRRRDWLGTFLELPHGVPSRSTFERVFAALSPRGLTHCLRLWLRGCAGLLGLGPLALDGKALCGSGGGAGLGPLHLVSAWATQAKVCLGQVAVAGKSNEITAIPELLRMLDLRGALVTLDAMGCQKALARQVVDQGGDYCFTVKDNQPTLARQILTAFTTADEANYVGYEHDCYETEERGHGRLEKRSYSVLYNLGGLGEREQWEKLSVVGMCYSERTAGDHTSEELRLFSGSRRASAKAYGEALRGHWGIENNCHWQLDVTFGEDDSSIRNRTGAQNFALLRKWALSLLHRQQEKDSIAVMRYNAALDVSYLQRILQGG
jgi:predicted transposase YbfD/YdcC